MNARHPDVSPISARIALLRGAMAREGVAACLVPSADPHLSEYLPEHWQARRWLSGFTGSVGTLVVTAEFAGLWVDNRYWVQAAAELAGTGVEVRPYEAALDALAALPADAALLIDPRRVTFGTLQAVPRTVRLVEAVNPSTFAKSRKTPAEIEHVRATMAQDGAALAEFFAWFEAALGRETITELGIDEQLTAARAGPASFRRASPPSPASTRPARCRITAPRRKRTRPSKATGCC